MSKTKHTIQAKVLAALEKRGWKRDWSAKTSKYIVMVRNAVDLNVYLGPNGAVRRGRTVATSSALSEGMVARLIVEGEQILEPLEGEG